jgi:hypothetical protein
VDEWQRTAHCATCKRPMRLECGGCTDRLEDELRDKLARLRDQVRIAREALHRVANGGLRGVSEAGCTFCLEMPRHLTQTILEGEHFPDCVIAAALAALSATTEAKEKSNV